MQSVFSDRFGMHRYCVTSYEWLWVRDFLTYCLLLAVSWQVVRKPRQVHMSVSDVFEGTPSFVSNILKWNSGETFNSYSGQHLHKYTFNLKGLQFEKICLKSLRSFEIEINFVFFHQSPGNPFLPAVCAIFQTLIIRRWPEVTLLLKSRVSRASGQFWKWAENDQEMWNVWGHFWYVRHNSRC